MTLENTQDRIDRYLMLEMTTEEAATFEAEMENDENLRRQTEFVQHLKEEMNDRHQRMKRMEEWDRKQSKRRTIRLTAWISGIAAALIICLLLTANFFNSKELNKLAHIEGTASRGNSSFSHIRQLINSDNYQEALKSIEEEKTKNTADKNKVEADTTLNDEQRSYKMTVVKNDADELMWMEAHALIGLGKKEEASTLLELISKENGYYCNQADSLKKLLKHRPSPL
mgnify:CR=1 FL=1